MSLRLKFAIAVSLVLHGALFAVLVFLTTVWSHRPTWLSAAGGVVWFNLNPGGLGSGGAGGLGAPQTSIPRQTSSPSSSEPGKHGVKPKTKVIPEKDRGSIEEVLAKPKVKPENKPAAWPGPGEGDTSGTQTGPGNGAGTGLGSGSGAGSGPGTGPGGVGPHGTGGGETGGEGSAVLNEIRHKILRAKRYPRLAREAGMEGVAGLLFEIGSDGSLRDVRLVSSSGYPSLDEEALATVRRAAPFPYYPTPIRFTLKFNLKDAR